MTWHKSTLIHPPPTTLVGSWASLRHWMSCCLKPSLAWMPTDKKGEMETPPSRVTQALTSQKLYKYDPLPSSK